MMKTALVLLLLCAASASSEPLVDQHHVTRAGKRLVASSHPLFFLGRNSRDILQGYRAVDVDDYSNEDAENFEEADDEGDTIYEDDDDENVTNDGNNDNDDDDREEDDREDDDSEDDDSEETQYNDKDENNKKIENFRVQHIKKSIKPSPLLSRDHLMGPNDDAVVEFMVKSITNTRRGGTAPLLVPLDETDSPRAKQLIVHRLPKGSQPNVIRVHIGGTDRGQNKRRRRVNKQGNIRVYVINGKNRRVVGNNRIKVIRL